MRPAAPVRKGFNKIAQMRTVSARLYKTEPRRSRLFSSFARIQGAVSSIYLFARDTTAKISESASGALSFSIAPFTFRNAPSAAETSSPSTPSALPRSGKTPPKYCPIIAAVRETRFPRSFARSELIRLNSFSFVYSPSLPKGISRRRK